MMLLFSANVANLGNDHLKHICLFRRLSDKGSHGLFVPTAASLQIGRFDLTCDTSATAAAPLIRDSGVRLYILWDMAVKSQFS
jgi:hypothetical protein